MAYFISFMCCGKEYVPSWSWYICDKCNYRICMSCFSKHKGNYGSNGGYKCSQCRMGILKLKSL